MGAAAIITLVGALLPSAITAAEKIFGSGAGSVKKQAVTDAVLPVLQAAAAAGKTAGSVIPADLEAALEATLAALKQTGAVPTSTPAAVATGTKLTVTGTLQVQA